jgi:hypothetical protein
VSEQDPVLIQTPLRGNRKLGVLLLHISVTAPRSGTLTLPRPRHKILVQFLLTMVPIDEKSLSATVSSVSARGQKSTRRGIIMAMIEDDDERLLAQIGYHQV